MITVRNLEKLFRIKGGAVQVLQGVDLIVERGEFFVLLGPSGSGKTTLLRCIAGLERPDCGEIVLDGRPVFSECGKVFIPAEERELGMVFQSYAIWPHMTVFENVALPLTQGKKRLPKRQVEERVREALQLVQMEALKDRSAPFLSGGQQQRVALARALAGNPKALLMDEPLSNLDARLREEVRFEIRDLVKRVGITTMYVTHDQVEAMALADRIAVMGDGKVLQVERPQELYDKPRYGRVAEFFGSLNWLEGRIEEPGVVHTELGNICIDSQEQKGTTVRLGIRPEDVHLSASTCGEVNEFQGDILSSAFLGDHHLYQLQVRTNRILVKAGRTRQLSGRVYFRIPKERVIVFPEAHSPLGGRRSFNGKVA